MPYFSTYDERTGIYAFNNYSAGQVDVSESTLPNYFTTPYEYVGELASNFTNNIAFATNKAYGELTYGEGQFGGVDVDVYDLGLLQPGIYHVQAGDTSWDFLNFDYGSIYSVEVLNNSGVTVATQSALYFPAEFTTTFCSWYVTSSTGSRDEGATISALVAATDAEGVASQSYNWYRGSTLIGTGSSYTLTETDIGSFFTIQAVVVDGYGNQAFDSFVLGTITGNYAPQITGGTVNFDENISTDTIVFDANASDQDSDPLTYSLGGTDGSDFIINQSNGEVRFANSPDYENQTSYSLTVTASDGSKSDTASVNVNIIDVDEYDVTAPTDTDSVVNSVSEGGSDGDYSGLRVSAADLDGTDEVNYSLTDDADGRFSIDPANGVVTVLDASLLDHETDASHTIEVTATSDDGSFSSQSFDIAVTDSDEFDVGTPTDSDVVPNAVSEASSVGDYTGLTVSATDLDSTDGVSYALTDDAEGRFTINPSTGVVTVADPSVFDYETDTSHTIEVTATSDDGSSIAESFTIAVTDDPEFKFVPSTAVTDLPLVVTDSEATQVFEHATDYLNPEGLFELPGGGILAVSIRDNDQLVLTKIAASGEIDTSFGSSGTVEYDLSVTGLTGFNEVTMTSSGKVIVGGGSGSTSYLIVDPSLAS
ncbi:cadherin domain-containing protein, partial [Shewanella sp.]|uniref:cadherin domain-containing protein n=1 Tax=Shewanella sp. TaxID=50422 RepID=UPI0040477065